MEAFKEYKPLAWQKRFHDLSNKRFRAMIGDYGAGKTTAGIYEAIDLCLAFPGTHGVICKKDYAGTSVVQKHFLSICKLEEIQHSFTLQSEFVKFKNGSMVYFRSADFLEELDNLKLFRNRSHQLDFFFIDYASNVSVTTFDKLYDLIKYSRLKASRMGFINTNHVNKEHWIFEKFVAMNDINFCLVETGSSLDNPYLTKEYREQLERVFPKG